MSNCWSWTSEPLMSSYTRCLVNLRTVLLVISVTVLLGSGVLIRPAHAFDFNIDSNVEIELISLTLAPLGPGNTDVLVKIDIRGQGTGNTRVQSLTLQDPLQVMDGDPLVVDSFFDVVFYVTVTDVDPNNDLDPALGPGPLTFHGLPSTLTMPPTNCPANTTFPNFGVIRKFDELHWNRNQTLSLPDGGTLGIPNTTLNLSFLDEILVSPLNQAPLIFEDRFQARDVSVWSRQPDFTVTTTGTLTIQQTQVIAPVAIGIPTLPQWGMILLSLSLLTLAIWQLAGRPVLVAVGTTTGAGTMLPDDHHWLTSVVLGQGLASLGLLLYAGLIAPLVPHDGIGAFLAGLLIGVMVESYRRGRRL